MKPILLFLALLSSAFADTYVAYCVRGSPDLFPDAGDANFTTLITSPEAVIEVFAETEGNSPTGHVRTYKIEYAESWDDTDTPASKATREIGTKFKVKENGDKISFEFSLTKLDRWISVAPPKLRLQPIFETQEVNSDLTIKKGNRVIVGGLTGEEIHEGKPRKFVRYIIIERK
jgi:hypothetical protein